MSPQMFMYLSHFTAAVSVGCCCLKVCEPNRFKIISWTDKSLSAPFVTSFYRWASAIFFFSCFMKYGWHWKRLSALHFTQILPHQVYSEPSIGFSKKNLDHLRHSVWCCALQVLQPAWEIKTVDRAKFISLSFSRTELREQQYFSCARGRRVCWPKMCPCCSSFLRHIHAEEH